MLAQCFLAIYNFILLSPDNFTIQYSWYLRVEHRCRNEPSKENFIMCIHICFQSWQSQNLVSWSCQDPFSSSWGYW